MKVIAVLQARMSSSRLPHKVLLPLQGKPMLLQQINRIQTSKLIDILVIATSIEPEDDAIEKLCLDNGIHCFRGSLDDVLDRFHHCSKIYKGEHIVRLTGDCPVIDSGVIDQVIGHHLESGADYTSNTNPPSYPDGLDVEVIKKEALSEAWRKAKLPSQREHVTPFIRDSGHFKLENLLGVEDLSNLRWTVDEQEDFELITYIYDKLYPSNPNFHYQDILALLNTDKDKFNVNAHISRNEGLVKSVNQDSNYLL